MGAGIAGIDPAGRQRLGDVTCSRPSFSEECAMADYLVYLLTPENRIAEARDFACADDREALSRAEIMIGIHAGAEVWSGQRLVSNPYAAESKSRLPRQPDA